MAAQGSFDDRTAATEGEVMSRYAPSMIRSGLIALVVLLSLPLRAEAIPAIQEAKLDNGLRVLLMEAHNVPMVSMQLVIPVGSSHDPKGHGGAAGLLADMLTDHTAKHDNVTWSGLLDYDAISLGAGADRDSLSFSLTVVDEALPQGLKALSEALLQPGWDKKRFRILKEDAVSAAAKARENPGRRGAEKIIKVLFGDYPYGHRSGGSAESLKRVTLDDLKALYRTQVFPKGSVLAVSGDIRMPELLHQLKPLLAGWKGAPQQGVFYLSAAKPHAIAREHVEMATKQAHLLFARLGPERKAADFFPAFLLNHILGGGGFSSRLMEEIREKRGLAYGAYSYFIPLAAPGPFLISLQTRADQADQAAKIVRKVLKQMHDGHIKPAWLKAAKDNMVGGFAQRLDSNHERVGLIGMIGFYDMPLDYLQSWTKHVNAVTLAQVKAAASRYLNPDDWNYVQVGPPDHH